MNLTAVDLEIQRDPFARPFGFKGAAFHEKWNMVVRLTDDEGREGIGVGGLAVLWSDEQVFAAHTEVGGNLVQAALLERALQRVRGRQFPDPVSLLNEVAPEVYRYGKTITDQPGLRRTFALNALVALDNAAWMLFARQQDISSFAELIPRSVRPFLAERQKQVAWVPTVGYAMPLEQVRRILDQGVFVLKVKLGQPGEEAEMLAKDLDRLEEVHEVAREYEPPRAKTGVVQYYLDINGRYARKDTLLRLLEGARRRGMADRILLVEEPFSDVLRFDVHDVPARLAVDESVHTVEDVEMKLGQGYAAVALKPAGKTLSLTFQMIEAAARHHAPTYVADNACVPLLVEWNKNVAARLPTFPGLEGNLLESNGPHTYPAWDAMVAALPTAGAHWLTPTEGAFVLDDEYYRTAGGIFLDPAPYSGLFRRSGTI